MQNCKYLYTELDVYLFNQFHNIHINLYFPTPHSFVHENSLYNIILALISALCTYTLSPLAYWTFLQFYTYLAVILQMHMLLIFFWFCISKFLLCLSLTIFTFFSHSWTRCLQIWHRHTLGHIKEYRLLSKNNFFFTSKLVHSAITVYILITTGPNWLQIWLRYTQGHTLKDVGCVYMLGKLCYLCVDLILFSSFSAETVDELAVFNGTLLTCQ